MFTPLTHFRAWIAHGVPCTDMRRYHPVVPAGVLVFVISRAFFLKGFLLLKSRPVLFHSLSIRAQHTTAKMRVSYASIAAVFTSVAYSQSIADLVGQIPSCALTCLATAATSAYCGLSDYACQCGPAKDAITKVAAPCIASACSADNAAGASIPLSLDNPNPILDSNFPFQKS